MEQTTGIEMKKPSRFTKWSLILGIVIVLNMFFNYAISLVYTEPKYDTYFARPQVIEQLNSQEECVSVGGQWTENLGAKEGEGKGYCDPDYTIRKEFDEARNVYDRNVFIVLVVLGILSIGLGVLLSQEVLATAFAWGGVLSLVIASMRYWSAADNIVKVIILAAALGGLIWLAVKKFSQ